MELWDCSSCCLKKIPDAVLLLTLNNCRSCTRAPATLCLEEYQEQVKKNLFCKNEKKWTEDKKVTVGLAQR